MSTAAVSLVTLQQQLQQLLDQRQALLAALRPPISKAQALLARLHRAGVQPDNAARSRGDSGEVLHQTANAVDEGLRILARFDQDVAQHESRIAEREQELDSLWYRFLDWWTATFSSAPTRKQQLDEARAALPGLHDQQEKTRAALRSNGGRLRACLYAFCLARQKELNANTDAVARQCAEWPLAAAAPWSEEQWNDWPPHGDDGKVRLEPLLAPLLRIGEFAEQPHKALAAQVDGEALSWLAHGLRGVTFPAVVPFIGAGRTLVVACDQRTEAEALSVVQAMVLRVAALQGRQALFTLLDPSGHGQAFPMSRFLRMRKNADVHSDLREVIQDIRRINQEVLNGEGGLHELEGRRLASESFEFIVAANFPKSYDRRAIETLFNIASAGPHAGRYVILHYNRDHPLPRDVSIDQLTNRLVLSAEGFSAGAAFAFHADELPAVSQRQELLDKINNAGRIDHSLAWDDLIGLPMEQWWTHSSELSVATPIGVRGATDLAEVFFGVKQEMTCAHGMLAAMTGAGKSTLYHVLILGLAIRYPPQELRMYLIDGKFGAEFRPYEHLPHAVVVSLNSPPELSRSVLEELFREMERRNNLFRQAGVEDLSRYRQRTGQRLPRLLLLIDEDHQLFDDDRDGQASELLRRLAAQGRSAGIHLFLGSQRFGAPGMLHQKDIFGNIHLKMAMKMQPEDIVGLTEFRDVGKRMIRDCDVAGKFVLNVTGRDEDTAAGKAAFLDPDRRTTLIAALRERAIGMETPPRVVFKGDEAPSVFRNTTLLEVLRRRPAPAEREALARQEAGPAGGFGQFGWVAADRPVGFWLGRLFNVHGHAMVVLRRRVSQHLAILGAPAEARAGMLAGLAVSLASLYSPSELSLLILHAGGDEEDPTVRVLRQLIDGLLRPVGFDVSFDRNADHVEALLDRLIGELERRKAEGAREVPSRLALLIEPDRMSPLRRVGDGLGRAANPRYDKLVRLLVDGPQHGIHLVMVASALRLLAQVIDERRDLPLFNHRVALQMSEDDSFALFRSRKAAQLQVEGSPMPCALSLNVETNQSARFKPYAAGLDLDTMKRVAQHLTRR
jgi:S-DNA-T family DNA segregation ATPase FtsK/SpoIIIE